MRSYYPDLRRSGAALLFAFALCPLHINAAQVTAVGGAVASVAASSGQVYAASGARLLRFAPDAAAPSGYAEAGATAPLPDLIRGIAVQDGRAYVAAGGAGVYLFDVSQPGAPAPLGSVSTPGYAEAVTVAGNLALVADGPLGLRILDVSDPAHPQEIACAWEGRQAMAVAVRDRYALVAAGGAGLLVADIANPAQPVEIAAVPMNGFASGIVLSAGYAFVMDSWGGIGIVDIANPAQPVLRTRYETPGWAVKGAVSGSLLAVADSFHGVRLLDIYDPLHPVESKASETFLGDVADVAFDGARIWVADRHDGLRSLNRLSNLSATTVYAPFSRAWSVAFYGNYAYVAAAEHGLRIVDISDPERPREVGAYPTCNAAGVTVSYPYVYLSNFFGGDTSGFHVVDVSDPANPRRLGFLQTVLALPMNVPRDHASVGTTSYVTNETGLIVIDAADPANPVVTGFAAAPPGGPTLGVTVRDGLAYVAQEASGLQIFDVSDLHAPKLLASAPLPNSPQDVDLAGSLALVAGTSGGAVVDISDPAHPIGATLQQGAGRGIAVKGSQAFYAASGGVQRCDVSNPRAPLPMASFRTPGYPRKAIPRGDRIWIADAETGLWSVPLAAMNRLTSTSAASPSTLPSPAALVHPLARSDAPRFSFEPSRGVRPRVRARASSGSCLATTRADSGPGSLRDCLESAGPGDTIRFDPAAFPPGAPATINLRSQLPSLTQGELLIDASSAGVNLDGSSLGDDGKGFVILSDGNAIQGFGMNNFRRAAVLIAEGASHNTIGGDRTQGTGPNGQGNVFGGGDGIDVAVTGAGTSANTIAGNYFKTSPDGLRATGFLPSGNGSRPCVGILDGAQDNTIGGASPGLRNVFGICAGPAGVLLSGPGTEDNLVIGNYIGVNAAGIAFHNCPEGLCSAGSVLIRDRASRNRIGGLVPGEANVISTSTNCDICTADFGTVDNAILGNYIGSDAAGTVCYGKDFAIWLDGGSSRTRVERNVLCRTAIGIAGDYNVVLGNFIGMNAAGENFPGSSMGGIMVANLPTHRNRIGGAGAGEGNRIAYPASGAQISLSAPGTDGNYVIGNLLVAGGGSASTNLGASIHIWEGAKRSVVGGSTDSEANTVSSGGGDGVSLGYEGVSFNFIARNGIVGNRGAGIFVSGADHTYIFGNRIASNGRPGVVAQGAATTIRNNSIHDNRNGILVPMSSATPLPAIRAVSATSVSGTACPSCLVEVFSDNGEQGAWFEGAVRANASGTFTLSKSDGFRGPNLTATATGADGLTSQFSPPARK
jgi:hypothetical protein